MGKGPLTRGAVLKICAGVPVFLVTPLLMRPVCLLSQRRFEEPVCHWRRMMSTSCQQLARSRAPVGVERLTSYIALLHASP